MFFETLPVKLVSGISLFNIIVLGAGAAQYVSAEDDDCVIEG
jgi:hypothetical protein